MGFVKTTQELNEIAALEMAHFYDAEMLIVYWETKPEIVARLLPPPLRPASRPLAMAFVANYPRTNFGPGYYEGALFLRAEFNGQPGNYCLSMPVTGDMGMALGREKYGFPKKLADITLERQGDRVAGTMTRHGNCFFTARARLGGQTNAADFTAVVAEATAPDPDCAVSYNFKQFLSPDGRGFTGFDYHPRLVRAETILRARETHFGVAEVDMSPSTSDPWSEIEIVRLLGAVYTVGNNALGNTKAIAKVDAAQFAPYAYLRWDW